MTGFEYDGRLQRTPHGDSPAPHVAEPVTIPGFKFRLRVGGRDGSLGGRDAQGGVIFTDPVVRLPGLPDGVGSQLLALDRHCQPSGLASGEDGTTAAVRWRCT